MEGLNDNVIAINNLYAEAQELCDVGGYAKFRELFCPQLGKSQAYVRLAIAAGKPTLVEHHNGQRERKQKSRAKQRAAKANSVTVPEKSKPKDAPTEQGEIEAPSAPVEQTRGPTKPRRLVTSGDEALRDFTERVQELDRMKKYPSTLLSGTAVSVEVLDRLGQRLKNIAKRKKRDNLEAMPAVKGTVSDAQPAEDTEAERPAQDAEELRQ